MLLETLAVPDSRALLWLKVGRGPGKLNSIAGTQEWTHVAIDIHASNGSREPPGLRSVQLLSPSSNPGGCTVPAKVPSTAPARTILSATHGPLAARPRSTKEPPRPREAQPLRNQPQLSCTTESKLSAPPAPAPAHAAQCQNSSLPHSTPVTTEAPVKKPPSVRRTSVEKKAKLEVRTCSTHSGTEARLAYVKKAGKHFGRPVWVCALGCGVLGWASPEGAATKHATINGIDTKDDAEVASTGLCKAIVTPMPPCSATTTTTTASGKDRLGSHLQCGTMGTDKDRTPQVTRGVELLQQDQVVALATPLPSVESPVLTPLTELAAIPKLLAGVKRPHADLEEMHGKPSSSPNARGVEAAGYDGKRAPDHVPPTSAFWLRRAAAKGEDLLALPRIVQLSGPMVLVGRGEHADVKIDSSRQPKMVSREHAVLKCNNEGDQRGLSWLIEDLGTQNGTAVNGVLVSGQCALADGDVIRFGRTQSEVQYTFCAGAGNAPASGADPVSVASES